MNDYARRIPGLLYDRGGAVVNALHPDFGARPGGGDVVANGNEVLEAAVAATPEGGTLLLPTLFRLTDTWRLNKAIDLRVNGLGAGVVADLSDPRRPAVVIGSLAGNAAVENVELHLNVYGSPGSCRHGVVLAHVHRARVRAHVRPGSTSHAVVVGGCLETRFDLVCQGNSRDGYPAEANGLWNGAAVLVADLRAFPGSGSSMPTNACEFDLVLEAGSTTGGFAMEPQPQAGGNNRLRGTLQGFMNAEGSRERGAGYAIDVEGAVGLVLDDALHVEQTLHGSRLRGCRNLRIGKGVFAPLPGETLLLSACTDFQVEDGLMCGLLRIDRDCRRGSVGQVTGSVEHRARHADVRVRACHHAGTGGTYNPSGVAYGWGNLFRNGDLSRWPDASPERVDGGRGLTLEPTGEGAADGTRRFHRRARRVAGARGAEDLAFAPRWSDALVGQPVTVWADLKWISGPELGMGIVMGDGSHVSATLPAGEPDWVRLALTVYPTAPFRLVLPPLGEGPYACYLGGYGAVVGVAAPAGGAEQGYASFEQGMQLAGRRHEYGAGPPSSGAWAPGDVVWNQTPAPGEPVGWVCLQAGTPGAWGRFGTITP